MTQELATRQADEHLPASSVQSAVDRYNAVLDFTRTIMKPGKDYGAIPGTDKPTLLKPGAEKLCSFFGLALDYEEIEKVCDWQTGFFFFTYKAILSRNGQLVATGIGSCNTKEKKYRWRNADRKCPKCGEATILKSKDKPEFFCWRKKGGCGAVFSDRDPAIIGQTCGKVENTETFDLVNTIQKMAQKRAMIAATLVAANASEFYTQDLDDLEIIEGDFTVHPADPPKQEAKPAPEAIIKPAPERVAELIRLFKAKSVPEAKVTEWLDKAQVDSFDDAKAETVEGLIKLVAKMPAPKAPKPPEQPDAPDADDYDAFISKCESAAQDIGLDNKALFAGLQSWMKHNKSDVAKLGADAEGQATVLKLIKSGRGYFSVGEKKLAGAAA